MKFKKFEGESLFLFLSKCYVVAGLLLPGSQMASNAMLPDFESLH